MRGFCQGSGAVANRTYRSWGHEVIFLKLTLMVRFQTAPTGPGSLKLEEKRKTK